MKKRIIIPYFPKGVKYITPLTILSGLYLAFAGHPAWGALLILLSIVILTTNYITEIDLEKRVYRDYLSFVWLVLNKEVKKFNVLDRVVITKGDYSQVVNTRIQSRQMDWSDYTATLLYDNDGSLNLLTNTSKRELLLALKQFTDFIQVDVEDCTSAHPYFIDMSKVE